MKCCRWLAMFFVLWSTPVMAQGEGPKTIQDFISACQKGNQYSEYCLGMTAGVSSLMHMIGNSSDSAKAHVGMCISEFVSNAQMIQFFLNWAKRNPSLWQKEGFLGFVAEFVRRRTSGV